MPPSVAVAIITLTSGFSRPAAGLLLLCLLQHSQCTSPASCGHTPHAAASSPVVTPGAPHQHAKHCFLTSEKQAGQVLGWNRNLINSIKSYRLATSGPMVSAPNTFPRRLEVRISIMQEFVRDHTGKIDDIGSGPSCPFRSSHYKQNQGEWNYTTNCTQPFYMRYNVQWYSHSGTQNIRFGGQRQTIFSAGR